MLGAFGRPPAAQQARPELLVKIRCRSVPIVVGATGVVIERTMLARLYKLDRPGHGLLLTFGLALIIQGIFRSTRIHRPALLHSTAAFRQEPGLHVPAQLPPGIHRGSAGVVCLGTWFVIERTDSAATCAPPPRTRSWCRPSASACPRMITLTYGFGVALAALAGVMAAPIYQVSPQMGSDLIIVVFAVVVIGGMGVGHRRRLRPGPDRRRRGVLRGLDHRDLRHHGHRPADPASRPVRHAEINHEHLHFHQSSSAPAAPAGHPGTTMTPAERARRRPASTMFLLMVAVLVAAFVGIYPVFMMKVMCFALRLRLQPAAGLRRPAVVRPRHVPGHGGLRGRRTRPAKVAGADTRAGDHRGHALRGGAGLGGGSCWPSRASTSP